MPELGEFNLEFAFIALRPLREDIEYQTGPVEHTNLQFLFQISFLARGQRVVEDHQLDLLLLDQQGQFLQLSTPNKKTRIGVGTLADQRGYGLGAC